MTLDPEVVQARIGLAQYVYGESLRGLAQALEIARQPPLVAEEKEILFGEVERAIWAFPDAFFVNPPMEPAGWAERADDDRIRDAVENGVKRIFVERKRVPSA